MRPGLWGALVLVGGNLGAEGIGGVPGVMFTRKQMHVVHGFIAVLQSSTLPRYAEDLE